MFIELVDALRCLNPHEATWLVASIGAVEDRDIVRGLLGCHVCGAEYAIANGVADFTQGRGARDTRGVKMRPEEETALRAAALLDLLEPGGVVALAGEWSACAPELSALVERVHVLGVDAPAGVHSGAGISLLLTHDELPLRAGAARGIALDKAHSTQGYLASAVEALRPQGRLLAPVDAPVPVGVTELTRDERHWLAVRDESAGPVVQLSLVRDRRR
jgi:hypothetical protein